MDDDDDDWDDSWVNDVEIDEPVGEGVVTRRSSRQTQCGIQSQTNFSKRICRLTASLKITGFFFL